MPYSSAAIVSPFHFSSARRHLSRGLLLSGSAGLSLTLAPAQAQNAASKSAASLAPMPLQPSAARVAIERAKQLESQGIPALAAVQFREAVAKAPTSLQAARELARFYSRQKRNEEAAEAWRQVLFLKRDDAEATTQLRRAQSQMPLQGEALPATGTANNDFSSTLSSAQTLPRLAQTPPGTPAPLDNQSAPTPAPLPGTAPTPDSQTPATPDSGTPTPDTTAPLADTTAPLADTTAPLADPPTPPLDVPVAPIETPAPPVFDASPTAPVAAPVPVPAPRVTPQRPASPRASTRPAAPRPPALVALNATPIPFVAPAPVARRVSKVQAAKAWPLVNKAAKELGAGRTASALKLYRQAYQIDPNNPYAGPGIGTSYIVLGRFNEAATAYRQFLALKPNDAKTLRGLADALTYGRKYREALGVNNAILARNSRDFTSNYQNGQILTYLRAYKQSDRYFQTAVALAPNNADARANVAVAWGESLSYRRDSRAVANFQRALSLRPSDARALAGLGNYYSYTNQFDLAIPRLRSALSLKPGDAALQIALGDALTYDGKPAQATPLYSAALQKLPNSVPARLGLGRALVYAGQSEKGAAQLVRVLSAQPGNSSALEALALAQSDFAPSAAIESYQTLLSRQSDAQGRAKTLATIGTLLARGNKFDAAIDSYAQASSLAPSDPKIGLAYAQLLAANARFDQARPILDAVLSREPDNVEALSLQVLVENGSSEVGGKDRAKVLAARLENTRPANVNEALTLADALRSTGNLASAQRVLENALTATTDVASALRIARATNDVGDYAGAAALYRKILASDSRNFEARLGLASVLTNQGDFDTALAQIQQVLAVDPNNGAANLQLADTQGAINTPLSREAAIAGANAILATDPNNVKAKIIVGQVLTSRQRFADAVTQFRSAIATQPNNLDARLGLARNLYYSREIEASVDEYRELIRRLPTDTLPRLELAQIYLDRNRFNEAEALFNEVLALRGGLPASATARWRVETRTYAKLSPLARINSPLNGKRAKSRRVVVDAPSRMPVSAAVKASNNAPAKVVSVAAANGTSPRRRIYLAQGPLGSAAPATTSGAAPFPEAALPGAATAPAADPTTTAPTDAAPGTAALAPDSTVPPIVEIPPIVETPPVPTDPGVASTTLPGGATPAAINDVATALRGLGEVRRRQGRFGEALQFFTQAVSVAPTDIAARIGVAQSLRGQAKYAEALQEVEGILSANPLPADDTLVPANDGSLPADAAALAARQATARDLAARQLAARDLTTRLLPARVLRAQLLGDTGQPEAAQRELDTLTSFLATSPENAPLETYLTLTQAFNSLRNYPASLQLLNTAAQIYPSEPILSRLRAETLTFARRTPEAIAIYDQLISADPQNYDAVLGKARVYNYSNQLDLAESTYRQVLTLQPANYEATTELADVLGRRTNYAESISLYQSAIATNPSDLATRVELARVQRYSGATADAEATLNTVLESDPRSVTALTERGVLRGTLGSYAPAIADLNAALAISPADLDAQLGLAEVQSYAGDYPASVAGYRAVLVRDPQNLKARTGLGTALSFNKQPDEALKELDAAIAQNPGDLDARLAKADVLGRATRTTEAVTLYNSILTSDPNNLRARTGLADAYLYGRQYPSAIKVYDALIATNPTNTNFRVQRARALSYDGRSKEAVTSLRAIVQGDPGNLPARLALAEAGTNSGNPALLRDAVADYRSVLSSDPSNVPAQVGLARALSYRGNYGAAKSQLNAVLAANPGNTDALYARAETERFSGDSFGAARDYKGVLQAQPTNAGAISGRRVVNRVTSPTLTLGGSYYNDTNGVRLRSFNPGFLFPTKAGTIGVLAERGRFEQNGSERDRNALSLLLARNFGSVQARLVLSQLKYEGVSSKTLYDLLLNNVRGPRQRYYLNVARRDIFESDAAVAQGITATFVRAGLTQPLGNKFDFEGQVTRYRYSDSNNRTSIQPSIYYRFRPTNPSLRVGLGYFYDNTSETRDTPFVYYTPQSFNATSLLADYVVDQGDTRFGLFGAYPLTGRTGDNGINRPAKTLFGFVNHDLSDALELFAQGGIVRSPDFRSNQVSGGVNLHF